MLPTRTTVWLFLLPLLLFPASLVYPLGQWLFTSSDLAAATRTYLTDSESARNWARAVAGELEQLTPDELPEIPAPSDNDIPYAAEAAGYLAIVLLSQWLFLAPGGRLRLTNLGGGRLTRVSAGPA